MTNYRRGAALLLVLATMVVILPALAMLTSRAVVLHRESCQTSLMALVDNSLPAIEDRVSDWLAHKSASVVLPIEAPIPRATVDAVQWPAEHGPLSIRITAFDLRGMLPVAVVRDTPLGERTLPELARTLRGESSTRAAELGLDGWSRRSTAGGGPSWYPPSDPSDGPPSSPGGLVAFDLAEVESAPVININTAPWSLVEAVARTHGVTELDHYATLRAAGNGATSRPRTASPDADRGIQLSHTSNAWAFRVDARSGSARRSWWLVYIRDQQDWRQHRRVPIDA